MRAIQLFTTLIGLGLTTIQLQAAQVTNIPEVGNHEPILIVEKNVNPQNKLVVYTKVDGNGRIQTDGSSRPVLDFYWLMGGRNYKPVNGLIKGEIRKRFVSQWGGGDRSSRFVVEMNDLKEVDCDIKDPKLEVFTGENGEIEAMMNLGPSDGNKRIRVKSIYTEGRTMPPTVDSVTVKGEEVADNNSSGKKVSRTYHAAGKKN